MKPAKPLPFSYIERHFEVLEVSRLDEGGYGIQIKTNRSDTSTDHFWIASNGLILRGPRKLAKEYNRRFTVTGMDEAVEKYST